MDLLLIGFSLGWLVNLLLRYLFGKWDRKRQAKTPAMQWKDVRLTADLIELLRDDQDSFAEVSRAGAAQIVPENRSADFYEGFMHGCLLTTEILRTVDPEIEYERKIGARCLLGRAAALHKDATS